MGPHGVKIPSVAATTRVGQAHSSQASRGFYWPSGTLHKLATNPTSEPPTKPGQCHERGTWLNTLLWICRENPREPQGCPSAPPALRGHYSNPHTPAGYICILSAKYSEISKHMDRKSQLKQLATAVVTFAFLVMNMLLACD